MISIKNPLLKRQENKKRGLNSTKFLLVFLTIVVMLSLWSSIAVTKSFDADSSTIDLSTEPNSSSRRRRKNSCQFLPDNEKPLPVILISLGRSGSSITWDTITRLTGDANIAYEITGGNRTKSLKFFNNINPSVGSYWAIERLCQIQTSMISKNNTHYGIIGFQWKPYVRTFDHKYSIGALEKIAEHRNPNIRVIFLTRNPIDRLISNQRHKGHINTEEVPHHCKVGDEECIKKHQFHSKNIILPTGQKLISQIGGSLAHDEYVREKLANIGVKHLHVSYEALFNKDTADEWMKIFIFLKQGPSQNLTMEAVREAFAMASTSSRRHKDTISNYDQVKSTLKGTNLYYLLH